MTCGTLIGGHVEGVMSLQRLFGHHFTREFKRRDTRRKAWKFFRSMGKLSLVCCRDIFPGPSKFREVMSPLQYYILEALCGEKKGNA